MFWWQRAAELARSGNVRRFGFITTNSLTQVFNRRVVAQNLNAPKNPLSLIFAIPDHPWLKALTTDEETISKAAAVRIAMTVAQRGEHVGHLAQNQNAIRITSHRKGRFGGSLDGSTPSSVPE